MTDDRTSEALEEQLFADLARLENRLTDAKFCTELYRTLTNQKVFRAGEDPERAHVSLSWKRVEDRINELRSQVDRPPLSLEASGGEGTVCEPARTELERLGWALQPLDTGRHDPQHVASEPDPPPPDQGARFAPGPRTDDEAEAHAAAEAERLKRISG